MRKVNVRMSLKGKKSLFNIYTNIHICCTLNNIVGVHMKRIIFFLVIFLLISLLVFETIFIFQNTSESMIEIPTNYTNIEPEKYYNIKEFTISNHKIYLAVNDTEKVHYILKVDSNYDEKLTFSSTNPSVASVDNYGNITSLSPGTTNIEVKIKDEIKLVEVTVTDLIIKEPSIPNTNKTILTCGLYTEEENDLLDEILESRVNNAGVSTRAGVLAAARFITLEFPYRLSYFSENGRTTTYGNTAYVDGEGRYYHKGLYLHKSRINNITKSMYGPNPWGCYIYSVPSEGNRKNGFDCSGFIAWIFLNGGFNPGDIGAGISNVPDMTDLGEKKRVKNSIENDELKAGDLLSGIGSNGGHIAMIIGMNNDKYFVAESLWGNYAYGAIARTYSTESLQKNFYWHIDMDNYYKNDGNYTEYWL